MSGSVCNTTAAMGLASFSILETLTPKCSLVDLPIISATERHAEVLQLRKKNMSSESAAVVCQLSPGGIIITQAVKEM